jgi:hypothetical protein
MTDTQRKAVVDGDGNVVNVILVDPNNEFDPGPGLTLVIDGGSNGQAAIGGRFDDGKFVDPPVPTPINVAPQGEVPTGLIPATYFVIAEPASEDDARRYHGQSTLADGMILVADGKIGGSGDYSADVRLYDPTLNTWTTKTVSPDSRQYFANDAALLADEDPKWTTEIWDRTSPINGVSAADVLAKRTDIPATGSVVLVLCDGQVVEFQPYDPDETGSVPISDGITRGDKMRSSAVNKSVVSQTLAKVTEHIASGRA